MRKQAEKELQKALLVHNTRVSEFEGALGTPTDDGYAIDRCDKCQQIKATILYTWDSRKPDEGGAECQDCRDMLAEGQRRAAHIEANGDTTYYGGPEGGE